jgi:hypothetical protein
VARGRKHEEDPLTYLVGFPLMVIPFAIYNMIAFLTPIDWNHTVATVTMVSGERWTITPEDILITLAILMLFIEFVKATRVGVKTIIDHMLSAVLFVVVLIEFLLVRQAATSTFFLLVVISFVDVIGGFTVTIRTAQRDLSIETERAITS